MKPNSIRARLAAWYSLILALSLCTFGGTGYLAMRHSNRVTLDGGLEQRIEGIRAIISQDAPKGHAALEDEIYEFATGVGSKGRVRVAEAGGRFIFASPGMESPSSNEQRHEGKVSRPFSYENFGGQRFRVLRKKIEVAGTPYNVEVASSTEDFDRALERFRLMLALAVPFVLVLAALGGDWMGRRALAPVDELTNAARSIEAHDLAKRLVIPQTGDELERLAETLNEMLERLEGAFHRITKFTADASHELRTPVSVMRTGAELILRKPRTGEEYREALSQILLESEKVSQLIEQLLILARTDAGPAVLPLTRTDLTETLLSACQEASPLAEAKQLTFSEPARQRGQVHPGRRTNQGSARHRGRLCRSQYP
jgi:signal transduction histidine kinase